jgi:hypothetical protein
MKPCCVQSCGGDSACVNRHRVHNTMKDHGQAVGQMTGEVGI